MGVLIGLGINQIILFLSWRIFYFEAKAFVSDLDELEFFTLFTLFTQMTEYLRM